MLLHIIDVAIWSGCVLVLCVLFLGRDKVAL